MGLEIEVQELKEEVDALKEDLQYRQIGPNHHSFKGPHFSSRALSALLRGKISGETYEAILVKHTIVGPARLCNNHRFISNYR